MGEGSVLWDPEPRPLGELLERDRTALDRGLPRIWVGVLRDRVITLGVGQRGGFAGAQEARRLGIPVLNRPSGGGSLLHLPGDLHFSVVVPREHPSFPRRFTRAYAVLGEGWVRWLAEEGREARWEAAPGSFPGYCLTGPLGEVLRTPGGILGGASQLVTSRGLLHHGVVSRTLDRSTLAAVFEMPGPVREGLTSLRELGIDPTEERLRRLARALSGVFGGFSPAASLGEGSRPRGGGRGGDGGVTGNSPGRVNLLGRVGNARA